MNGRLMLASLLVWLPFLAAACVTGSHPQQASPSDEGACDGQMVLVVQNNSRGEIEIVESRRGSGARIALTVLGPGAPRGPDQARTGLFL